MPLESNLDMPIIKGVKKMRLSVLFFTTIVMISNSLAQGQGFTLTGYVKDAKNGTPLAGANVLVVGTSIGTAAIENGQYKISDLKEGKYLIRAEYIGYITVEDSISVTDDGDINLDFNLNYTTIEGKEVNVTAQAKGQMDAINRQLNARSFVNIVSSDRIQ